MANTSENMSQDITTNKASISTQNEHEKQSSLATPPIEGPSEADITEFIDIAQQ